MDLVWIGIVAASLMLGIILAVCGFVVLAPVYVVRKELISKLISRTYCYLASDSKHLELDDDDLQLQRVVNISVLLLAYYEDQQEDH